MAAESRGRVVSIRRVQADSTGKRIIEQGRLRLLCVLAFFTLSFIAIGIRLVEVSVVTPLLERNSGSTSMLVAGAETEVQKSPVLPGTGASRGDIVDRNGMLLATSLQTASLYANPKEIRQPAETAKKLASVLDLPLKSVQRSLVKDTGFVWIKRNLTPREQDNVLHLGIPGLYFENEERRVYPQGRLLSHVLGYVGVDAQGLAGIEQYFNQRLRDPQKNAEPLELSIDMRVQHIVHEELEAGVKEFSALGATGLVYDISSGELLAMANLPDFDPHHPTQTRDEARFNRASLGSYEMGSTFKTFTVAMALDYGIVGMRDGYDASHPIKVSRYTISDSHPKNRWLSVPEIFAYSSNIGTVKMIMDVGTSRQKAFLQKLGLFSPVEVELPELSRPSYPSAWRDIHTMTIAYGHGMSVSPLHLVRGIASLIGDGTLARLTLLKNGNAGRAQGPVIVKNSTVTQLRRLLRLVVEEGTGSKADVPGYRVGGKTGTAEKVKAGGYKMNSKMALFVSAFPIDSPRFLVLVMLDEPQPTKATFGYATGGWTAAPVAGKIISRLAPLYGVRPVYNLPADDAGKFWVKNGKLPQAGQIHAVSY